MTEHDNIKTNIEREMYMKPLQIRCQRFPLARHSFQNEHIDKGILCISVYEIYEKTPI